MRHPWWLVLCLAAPLLAQPAGERRLTVAEYRDKMLGGWLGQMIGVAWGAPTEFHWQDQIMPADRYPSWSPGLINGAFDQDDLYVEMTFLGTLERGGLNVSIREAGIDFANSEYPLWCANRAGRNNLREGIAPPDSSHPRFNACPNDIDYQIEADYSGLIAPGLPQVPIDLGNTFGRLMNYGDGLYAGQFVGACYAAAFFESDPRRIVEIGLEAIPAGSQYAEMVRDLLAWSAAEPDWQACWRTIQAKYREDPVYQQASNGGIDAKINGAYVLLGLLYGDGELEPTIEISCRAGQDSDCNPSTAAGILATARGASWLSDEYVGELSQTAVFSHTPYDMERLLAVCEQLARDAVVASGGRIEGGAGAEVLVIPAQTPQPNELELSWAPGPIANTFFRPSERRRITQPGPTAMMAAAVEKLAPGWSVAKLGPDMDPGWREEWRGRQGVLLTHPQDRDTAAVLSRELTLPAGRPRLALSISHHPEGDWDLVVRINGEEIARQLVGPTTSTDGWLELSYDLSRWAGQAVRLELLNMPNGWTWEAAYWHRLEIVTE
ncbi:MAG TPA: hypothetical protein DCZ72_01695 [Armatimonadetes bacterium]|nr:hypothetical protein [Armatimonadota bacterium]